MLVYALFEMLYPGIQNGVVGSAKGVGLASACDLQSAS
jgi:hypothetical protein